MQAHRTVIALQGCMVKRGYGSPDPFFCRPTYDREFHATPPASERRLPQTKAYCHNFFHIYQTFPLVCLVQNNSNQNIARPRLSVPVAVLTLTTHISSRRRVCIELGTLETCMSGFGHKWFSELNMFPIEGKVSDDNFLETFPNGRQRFLSGTMSSSVKSIGVPSKPFAVSLTLDTALDPEGGSLEASHPLLATKAPKEFLEGDPHIHQSSRPDQGHRIEIILSFQHVPDRRLNIPLARCRK